MLKVTDFKPWRLLWLFGMIPFWTVVIAFDIEDTLSGEIAHSYALWDYGFWVMQYFGFLGMIAFIFGIKFGKQSFWKYPFFIDLLHTMYYQWEDIYFADPETAFLHSDIIYHYAFYNTLLFTHYGLLWAYAFEARGIWYSQETQNT
ncbi:hypothetical protein [Algicola sagamiensis]|uniref:hypothetical protein n=1 Tax=Algicola sagamiensis TaxID=163869 RepID=UPI00037C562C|nr:hypothetical protein [Algicola sagamiensis]